MPVLFEKKNQDLFQSKSNYKNNIYGQNLLEFLISNILSIRKKNGNTVTTEGHAHAREVGIRFMRMRITPKLGTFAPLI